jgi:hypothetical protein
MAFNPASQLITNSATLNPTVPVAGITGPVYIASTQQVATVNAALRALFAGTAAINEAHWLEVHRQILLTYAFNGTSPAVASSLAGTFITNVNPHVADAAPDHISMADITAVIQAVCTVRRYCRAHAYYVWTYATANNFTMPLGSRHGVPVAHGALGFDFVDALHLLPSLSDAQRTIVNLMKRVALRDASDGPTHISNDASRDHANSIEF